MGQNSALKARIKHAQKNTPTGRRLRKKTKDLNKNRTRQFHAK